MSAGEFFELIRPAVLIISGLLSVWVLAVARRRYSLLVSGMWALGAFFLPVIVLPIFLLAVIIRKQRFHESSPGDGRLRPRFRSLAPIAYGVVLLFLIAVYVYRDHNSVDAHLARAEQAKVMNQRDRAIKEYQAALKLEDNPHTHKLLGIELAAEGNWEDAAREFCAAEAGREPDELLSYRFGQALIALGRGDEGLEQYRQFLNSSLCKSEPVDDRCEIAAQEITQVLKR
jgi:hypothetical protein